LIDLTEPSFLVRPPCIGPFITTKHCMDQNEEDDLNELHEFRAEFNGLNSTRNLNGTKYPGLTQGSISGGSIGAHRGGPPEPRYRKHSVE